MKVADIAIPLKSSEDISEYDELKGSSDLETLKISDIDKISLKVVVKDDSGRLIGTVDKGVLSFLNQSCDSWILGQITDKFHEGIIAVDASGRIFFVNDTYSRIIGVAKNFVLGRHLQVIEPGAVILDVLKTGEAVMGKPVHIKSVSRDVIVNIYPIKRDDKLVAVVSIFRDVTETKKLTKELDRAQGLAEYFRQQLVEQDELEKNKIIGKHPIFLKAVSQAIIVAKTDAPVLVDGENGVGKEILARLIHQKSGRNQKPLITVNCAAIPENLLESELFGYEEGSFTGAKRGGKLGKFELAEGGTIFLDEIGDMPLVMQAKILRVLQEKEVEKIGRLRNVPVDVRIIAATNKPLDKMVKQGTFRNDLYYRLNVVEVTIPPLRDRGEDINLLAYYFLQNYNAKYEKNLVFSIEAMRFFNKYNWPGNVRELQNCIEYAVIMCQDDEILLSHLPAHMEEAMETISESKTTGNIDTYSMREKVQLTEKDLIEKALIASGNNKSKAIKMLGISRRSFYRKLKEFGYM